MKVLMGFETKKSVLSRCVMVAAFSTGKKLKESRALLVIPVRSIVFEASFD